MPAEDSLPYARLCEYYQRLEDTASRLEMTDILVELLREAPAADVDLLVYLTQGKLGPDFQGLELGLAAKLVVKGLSFVTGRADAHVTALFRESGDLGDVAQSLSGEMRAPKGGNASKPARQTTLFGTAEDDEEDAEAAGPLTVRVVFDAFHAIAGASGTGSQERKLTGLQNLLLRAEPLEAKFIVRTVTGKLRLGIADMTLLDALASAFAEKSERPVLEHAYNVSSDLGRVARVLLAHGMDGVKALDLEVGIPVRAMLAERLPTAEAILDKLGGDALVEWKYDGLRLQAHVHEDGRVEFYSRRLENLTPQFPDVAENLRAAFRGKNAIVEGEAVPVDPATGEIRPFQFISTRRGRKHNLEQAMEDVPAVMFLFDCLLLDGEDVAHRPLPERREALMRAFSETDRVKYSRAERVTDTEHLLAFFDESVTEGSEGIMCKSVADDSFYRAGSRGWQWIKFKRDYKAELSDTLDLVVVGAFAGRGRRKGWYGALLMGAYNPEADVFETVCKLGTGFDDETLASMTEKFKPHLLEHPHARVASAMKADYWFEPAFVMEVVGAEMSLSPIHTAGKGAVRENAGFAVRFPRFTGRWRDDKAPEDATTIAEIEALYRAQGAGSRSGSEQPADEEE